MLHLVSLDGCLLILTCVSQQLHYIGSENIIRVKVHNFISLSQRHFMLNRLPAAAISSPPVVNVAWLDIRSLANLCFTGSSAPASNDCCMRTESGTTD